MPLIDGVNDADIQKFEIDDSIVSDNQAIGSFNLNTATIKLINPTKRYSSLKDQWIDTLMGKLYVYEAPEAQGDVTIELKCYDLAYKFDLAYEDVIEFPATNGEWLAAICAHVGVELATPEFTNSDLLLGAQPYLSDGASFRDAVKEIAGSSGGFAQIIDNKLHVKWFDGENPTELADWFSLTQEEHVDPVNVVVLGRGDLEDNIVFPTETPENPHELRIDDNQVLFQLEREAIEAIYNQVNGFEYRVFNLRFIGLKNLKAGQKVRYRDIDGELVETFVMTNSLSFCGGDYNNPDAWESTISSVHLNETSTNYKYAGSVMKSIKNTEAKVDKTNQRIEMIVSEQKQLEDQMNESFTKVEQNITSVVTSVQSSGGSNLIRNSAMYFKESGKPTHWEVSETGNVQAFQSADASRQGSLSGQVIRVLGATVSQEIRVKPDNTDLPENMKTYYTFSCRVRKEAVGDGSIIFSDGHQEWKIELGNGEVVGWQEYVLEAILPLSSSLTVTISTSADAEIFDITDMMLAVGNYKTQWTQANGELANMQVQIDSNGMEVHSSTASGVASKVNHRGITVKENDKVVAELTQDGLVAKKAEIATGIKMPPLQVRALNDGWAFVPTV